MKIAAISHKHHERGSTMIVVIVVAVVALMIAASILGWVVNNTTLSERHNEYYKTVSVAEAATEKVISRLAFDYQQNGEAQILANLDDYRSFVPTVTEDPEFGRYEFFDVYNQTGRTQVENVPPNEFRVLSAQYRGLRGYGSRFRVISNARQISGPFNIAAAVRQDIELATIPLFQFAIFYVPDLEINPGPVMAITGPVHCNNTIYLDPQATLTFEGDVTAAGSILHHKKPGDPSGRPEGAVTFHGEHDSGVSTLNLPIGTNTSPVAVRQVLEIPPVTESPHSAMGKERFYNKADLIIIVRNTSVSVTSGRTDNFGTTLGPEHYTKFLSTGVSFFNQREQKTVRATQLDIAQLREFNRTNSLLRSVLPLGDIRIVYVDDQRTQTATSQTGVRVVNGETILPQGLTIATPDPIYVRGHYNAPPAVRGTSNTGPTLPAALIGDAITILSPAWNDSNGSSSLGNRVASDTTVNAAFLAGIVETITGSYSGGVENFPRFLEDWSGRTLTYNGSMVVMFPSQVAIGQWKGTGSSIGIYNPPNRRWAFDQNFRTVTKLPPGTPCVRALIRGSWAMVRPNSTEVVEMY